MFFDMFELIVKLLILALFILLAKIVTKQFSINWSEEYWNENINEEKEEINRRK